MHHDHRSLERISLFLAAFCLALCSGYLSGRMLSVSQTEVTLRPDTRPPVPTVHIRGVRNGLLHGQIIGSARVVIGSNVMTQSGVFAFDAGPLLINEISITIPSWATYVASKRGTRYYPINAAAAKNIVPQNRLYFRSRQDAESAGYLHAGKRVVP